MLYHLAFSARGISNLCISLELHTETRGLAQGRYDPLSQLDVRNLKYYKYDMVCNFNQLTTFISGHADLHDCLGGGWHSGELKNWIMKFKRTLYYPPHTSSEPITNNPDNPFNKDKCEY